MCGIWTFISLNKAIKYNPSELFEKFQKIKHRGPDMSGFQNFKDIAYVGFHRLSIMDPTFHANQPYILEDVKSGKTIVFICNGEIYNYKELIKNYDLDITTNSDCMTIPKLYLKYDLDTFNDIVTHKVIGEYAFILIEFDTLQNIKNIMIGRDLIGIRPLYWSYDNDKVEFCSEIKGMYCIDNVKEFSPNLVHLQMDDFGFLKNLNTAQNMSYRNTIISNPYIPINSIRTSVINSIKRRLIADKPISFLLSGGLDSSLVASISARILGIPINTYCCGMKGGTDLAFARKVADFIGSNHTEVIFTPEQGIEAIRDVIYTTETWDTTTIRASIGQYLVCKYIGTKTDAKVIMVGEGPDEVCSSYLFNNYAPSFEELDNAATLYVARIHMYDGRRADRCGSRWGLETRVPLLDTEFIKAYWSHSAESRHPSYGGIEKFLLRDAFSRDNLLPSDVLWRSKEAFSDGVSSKEKSWFNILQDYINTQVTVSHDDPTNEAYYYKKIFIELFGEERVDVLPGYWQPKWIDKKGTVPTSYVDPSARTLSVYNELKV